jgi:hypothetical protein
MSVTHSIGSAASRRREHAHLITITIRRRSRRARATIGHAKMLLPDPGCFEPSSATYDYFGYLSVLTPYNARFVAI